MFSSQGAACSGYGCSSPALVRTSEILLDSRTAAHLNILFDHSIGFRHRIWK